MIQVYARGNTDYKANGNMTLLPTSCRALAELNGLWKMELTHPIDQEGRWRYIEEEGVISANTFMSNTQLFRVKEIEKTDTEITALAVPIFMDSEDECFLLDVRPTGKNGQEALNLMVEGSKYSGESDIKAVSTAYFVRRNLMSAINGNDVPSFIGRWGGEILYDNYKVIINERVGGDHGVEVRYGKNMEGIDYKIDMSEMVTRIIPVAYNGHMLEGKNPWVDSKNIKKYAKIYTREVKFEDVKLEEDASGNDTSFKTLEALRKELIKRCEEMYESGVDLPKVNIKVNMVDLSRCREYEEYKELEKVGLGDIVRCYNSRLDITTSARVIKIEWDCIRNVPETITLGDFEYNYFNNLTSTLNAVEKIMGPNNTIAAENIQGVINGMTAKLRAMRDIAETQHTRAVLFEDLNPESPTYGAMAIGTAGFEIAGKRTADGNEWDWSTFGTAQGFYATYLIAGVLASRNWKKDVQGFQFDLDHGTLNSKHLKLDDSGLLRIYQAIIEGGSFSVYYTDKNGYKNEMFVVNENGVGIGPGGQFLTYYAGDLFMSLSGELRLLTGKMVGYAANGQKAIEMNRTNMEFYSWNDAGNYVGGVGSVKANTRVGLAVWCDEGDILQMGYRDSGGTTIHPVITIDSKSPDGPPRIKGGATGEITSVYFHNETALLRQKIYVKNGIITGWEQM